jgi:hypothetical protein
LAVGWLLIGLMRLMLLPRLVPEAPDRYCAARNWNCTEPSPTVGEEKMSQFTDGVNIDCTAP